jgi:hypothetical protein
MRIEISFIQKRLCNFKGQLHHVSRHDFIFSNEIRFRLARHGAFVFACWLFYLVTFYIPLGVFPAWNTEQFATASARLGFPTWLKLRLFNATMVFLPLIPFAYLLLYFVLPRFFFNKKNLAFTIAATALIIACILPLHYLAGWIVDWNMHRIFPSRRLRPPDERIWLVLKGVVFNYPIIGGFAVIVKMMKRSWLNQQETLQIAREKAGAELQLLKAQIHPHFLFNTLNNIYFFTLTSPQKAPEMLMKLTDILRYIINECNLDHVPLKKELKMIENFMDLERIRYGDRLKMELDIKGEYHNKTIPPLLLIPLVENSFKHGTSKMLNNAWVRLDITIEGQHMYFLLSNSRPDETKLSQHNGHIGLNNVKKRLQLLYPEAHEISITENTFSYEVFLKIRLQEFTSSENEVKPATPEYAIA